jgi:hypothetical protein
MKKIEIKMIDVNKSKKWITDDELGGGVDDGNSFVEDGSFPVTVNE